MAMTTMTIPTTSSAVLLPDDVESPVPDGAGGGAGPGGRRARARARRGRGRRARRGRQLERRVVDRAIHEERGPALDGLGLPVGELGGVVRVQLVRVVQDLVRRLVVEQLLH